jgi:hypothetical protein
LGLERIEAEVVRRSLANLITFLRLAEAIAADRLALRRYCFDVHTSVLAGVGTEKLEPSIEERPSLLQLPEEVVQSQTQRRQIVLHGSPHTSAID